MKKLVLIVFMCIFPGLTMADQMVTTADGQLVRLKDDHTWEFVETSGDEGKVVFSISKAKSKVGWRKKMDDMDEFSHYFVYVGCQYHLTVENKTAFKVKVKKVSINTDVREYQSDYSKTFYFNKLLEPGEKHTSTDWSRNGIWGGQHKAKEEPSEERQKELIEKHGCKAQSGEVFVTKTWASEWEDNIVFSKDAGISGDTIGEFVVGSPNGMFPLQEKFRF